ncbi:MAG: putative MPP superfamily phosphohydrolase [Crocinitomix sp.]|jgi:predicted MPP superfamily phosphohydrolase
MPIKFNRRKFLKRSMIVGGAGLLTGLYAWRIEPFWLEFVHHKMPIKNLPNNLNGLRLMQISDMHVGNRFDRQYLIDSLKEAQALEPDIVVYTGDFVSYDSEEQFDQLEEVLKHRVVGKLGTVGVLGNHDYGKDWEEEEVATRIIEILEENGVQMLRNSSTEVAGLNVIGIDDYWATNFKPELAFQDYDASKANLVLCHNPDVADLDVWNGYQGWILCGHTHGGQCKPPFLNPPMLPVKNKAYSAGEVDLKDGRKLYINRALGHLWQIRFNVRPEITIFELSQA